MQRSTESLICFVSVVDEEDRSLDRLDNVSRVGLDVKAALSFDWMIDMMQHCNHARSAHSTQQCKKNIFLKKLQNAILLHVYEQSHHANK